MDDKIGVRFGVFVSRVVYRVDSLLVHDLAIRLGDRWAIVTDRIELGHEVGMRRRSFHVLFFLILRLEPQRSQRLEGDKSGVRICQR